MHVHDAKPVRGLPHYDLTDNERVSRDLFIEAMDSLVFDCEGDPAEVLRRYVLWRSDVAAAAAGDLRSFIIEFGGPETWTCPSLSEVDLAGNATYVAG